MRINKAHVCPNCGAVVNVRFDEVMTRMQASILDMILDISRAGRTISTESLCAVFFPGLSLPVARRRVITHVHNINERLASTDVRIISKRNGKNSPGEYRAIGWTDEQIEKENKANRPWLSNGKTRSEKPRRIRAGSNRKHRQHRSSNTAAL
jgi:hypothetical protein